MAAVDRARARVCVIERERESVLCARARVCVCVCVCVRARTGQFTSAAVCAVQSVVYLSSNVLHGENEHVLPADSRSGPPAADHRVQ